MASVSDRFFPLPPDTFLRGERASSWNFQEATYVKEGRAVLNEPKKPELGNYIVGGLAIGMLLGVMFNKVQFGPLLGLVGGLLAHNIAMINYRKKTGDMS